MVDRVARVRGRTQRSFPTSTGNSSSLGPEGRLGPALRLDSRHHLFKHFIDRQSSRVNHDGILSDSERSQVSKVAMSDNGRVWFYVLPDAVQEISSFFLSLKSAISNNREARVKPQLN